MFQTPILFITFNRPNHTRRVWEEIKKQRPKKLYIFQDGARKGNDADQEKCKAVHTIFSEPIDWECELHVFHSDKNLGCGKGPSTGISWFFQYEEQGIILEDDAIPAPDFFNYASELLEKYKDTEKIKVIGSMHLDGKQYGKSSYHFSMANRNLCAWATWKRSWNAFDYYLLNISNRDLKHALSFYKASLREIEYWCDRLTEIHKDRLGDSSWDMQFLISIWLQKGIGVFPNVNLSSNIGFDAEATHTSSVDHIAAACQMHDILPLVHPECIKISRKADLNYHKLYFQPMDYGLNGLKRLPYRINKRIKNILGIHGSWIKK